MVFRWFALMFCAPGALGLGLLLSLIVLLASALFWLEVCRALGGLCKRGRKS